MILLRSKKKARNIISELASNSILNKDDILLKYTDLQNFRPVFTKDDKEAQLVLFEAFIRYIKINDLILNYTWSHERGFLYITIPKTIIRNIKLWKILN